MARFVLAVRYRNFHEEFFLPTENHRSFLLNLPLDAVQEGFRLSVHLEVRDGKWSALETQELQLFHQSGQRCSKIALEKGLTFFLQTTQLSERLLVVVQERAEETTAFEKYKLTDSLIGIGAAKENHIVYKENVLSNATSEESGIVSRYHAQIAAQGGGHILQDNPTQKASTNGVYVNGIRVQGQQSLVTGDVITIAGLKMVYLGKVLAINHHPKEVLQINGLTPYLPEVATKKELAQPIECYHRKPRLIDAVYREEEEIEGPPAPSFQKRKPLLMTIGPSFTMVIPMVLSVLFSVWISQQSGSTTSAYSYVGIVTAAGSAVMGVCWGLSNYRYSKKTEKEREKQRVQQYTAYLDKKVDFIAQNTANNLQKLHFQYPSLAECQGWLHSDARRLWERNANHADFLWLRLGTGTVQNPLPIKTPKDRFSVVNDFLAEEPRKRAEAFLQLEGAPVCFSMKECALTGIVTETKLAMMNLVRALILQLAFTHAHNDVKMLFIYDQESEKEWAFTHWLPHAWLGDKSLRLTANDSKSIAQVLYQFAETMRRREEALESTDATQKNKKQLPHYVVFVTDPKLIEGEAAAKYLLNPSSALGLSTILLYGEVDLLPNHCTNIIESTPDYSGYYSIESAYNGNKTVSFDYISAKDALAVAKKMSRIIVRESEGSATTPQRVNFLEMYHVGKIEDLNIYERWMENRVYESMRAMIGLKSGAKPLYLDIHEKAHGPHGLMAGTTGSGKSETLQSYILSMAIMYHPYEISFILIDYKGGGMAHSFEGLPHLAGILTNLSGSQTARALISINSEVKRREHIFNQYRVKHIDAYIELYRSGQASDPMPHLLIVADEFAELKQEQPEFVQELVRISRTGRSLGIHLVLATQQPDKAIDDEIWNNSKFHLCLRVQSKDASKRVINRADAAYITNPGAGYFQVGNDEIFEPFQSGWSGAEYDPKEGFDPSGVATADLINECGLPAVVISKAKEEKVVKLPTQLDAIVRQLATVSAAHDLQSLSPIWLDPLAHLIELSDLPQYDGYLGQTDGILLPLGVLDNPATQSQSVYQINLLQAGHIWICGASGSGKTNILQSILYNAVARYAPNIVEYYILDFNTRMLNIFSALPHSLGFASALDGARIEKMVESIHDELEHRKRLFAAQGYASFQEYRKQHQNLSAILFIIDGYQQFREYSERLEMQLVQLAREAASCGIYLVITSSAINGLSNRMRQEIGCGIGLQLPNIYDYESVLSKKPRFAVENGLPGRGVVLQGTPLECQFARCIQVAEGENSSAVLQKKLAPIQQKWNSAAPKATAAAPGLPQDVSQAAFFASEAAATHLVRGQLPFGYQTSNKKVASIDLTKHNYILISDPDEAEKQNLLEIVMQHAAKTKAHLCVLDDAHNTLQAAADAANASYITDGDAFIALLTQQYVPLFKACTQAANAAKENGEPFDFWQTDATPIYIVIKNYAAFKSIYQSCISNEGNKSFFDSLFANIARFGIVFVMGAVANDKERYITENLFNQLKSGGIISLGEKPSRQRYISLEGLTPVQRDRQPSAFEGICNFAEGTEKIVCFHTELP